jgi:hypothetical protein
VLVVGTDDKLAFRPSGTRFRLLCLLDTQDAHDAVWVADHNGASQLPHELIVVHSSVLMEEIIRCWKRFLLMFKDGENGKRTFPQLSPGCHDFAMQLTIGDAGGWAAGNYSVIVKDQTIHGNWFRILKPEAGTWKIAMEAFARSDALDAPASASPAPSNGK